ncbi:hypothetical protein D3C87_1787750 [compost metagenome]
MISMSALPSKATPVAEAPPLIDILRPVASLAAATAVASFPSLVVSPSSTYLRVARTTAGSIFNSKLLLLVIKSAIRTT